MYMLHGRLTVPDRQVTFAFFLKPTSPFTIFFQLLCTIRSLPAVVVSDYDAMWRNSDCLLISAEFPWTTNVIIYILPF